MPVNLAGKISGQHGKDRHWMSLSIEIAGFENGKGIFSKRKAQPTPNSSDRCP